MLPLTRAGDAIAEDPRWPVAWTNRLQRLAAALSGLGDPISAAREAVDQGRAALQADAGVAFLLSADGGRSRSPTTPATGTGDRALAAISALGQHARDRRDSQARDRARALSGGVSPRLSVAGARARGFNSRLLGRGSPGRRRELHRRPRARVRRPPRLRGPGGRVPAGRHRPVHAGAAPGAAGRTRAALDRAPPPAGRGVAGARRHQPRRQVGPRGDGGPGPRPRRALLLHRPGVARRRVARDGRPLRPRSGTGAAPARDGWEADPAPRRRDVREGVRHGMPAAHPLDRARRDGDADHPLALEAD